MLRVGIVDDHLLFRKSMTLLINSFEDIKVEIEASNGKDFLDKLKNTPVDVVLLDIQMPVMNGFEATRQIRNLSGPRSRTKIMAMTANVTEEEINNCFASGMDEYLAKPFDQTKLLQKLVRLYLKRAETTNQAT